jgi:hypothetical protein
MTKEQIQNIVSETVKELIRLGVIGQYDRSDAYTEIVGRLREYYKNDETDSEMRPVVLALEDDRYYRILQLAFDYGKTNEQIAEYFDCDMSTIVRNKKRLCLAIYDALQ